MSLGSYPESASGDSAQALWELSERVQRFLDHSWSAADEDLEPLLSSIRANSGGQLLAAAALQSRYLEHANDVLRSASKEGIYCRNEAITDAGRSQKRWWPNTLLQMCSDGLHRCHSALRDSIGVDCAGVPPDIDVTTRYLDWVTERNALLHRLYAATREHVAAIKKTVNAC